MTPGRPHEERDTPMTVIYIAVVIVEAVIIGFLFLLGRIYT